MENNYLPKWMLKTLGILLIIFLAVLIVKQLQHPSQTMRVSAEGKVTAVPDVARVTIGVISEGRTPVEVKDSNNKKINQVIDFIKEQGIDKKDIKTTNLYASPKYNYVNGQSNIAGYQANQTITVKVSRIDKSQEVLEKILDGVVQKGANEIQGISFDFSDPAKLKQQARKKAIENAKEKASEMASEADLWLGKIVNVSETSNDLVNPMAYAPVSFAATRNKSVAPNIEPGNQDVVETMTVVFEVY